MLKPRVQVHDINGILVAEFWDCLRLDPAPVLELRRRYEAHVNSHGRPDLVIDMLGVEFAGSAALGNFVSLHKLARPRGGRLIFCNVDPMVVEVFRISKLDTLFCFEPDRDSALALAASPPPDPPPNAPSAPQADAEPPRPRRDPSEKSVGNGLRRGSRRRKLS